MSAAQQLPLALPARTVEASSFEAFHRANPQVYSELVRLAREAKAAGYERIGIRMCWEVARWNLALRTSGSDGFKLNNNLSAQYARLIMRQERDLAGIFEIRGRDAERTTEGPE